MALGGGTFISQNKKLPGSYINFVSLASASAALSDRGIAAMAFEMDWGEEGKIIEITSGDLQKNSMKIFGYDYASDKLKGIRDLFCNARLLYGFRLNSGGVKATCDLGNAKYSGERGNALTVVISTNVDDEESSDVKTFLDGTLVDSQTVKTADKTTALADNDFIVWTDDVELSNSAGTKLTGGTNGTATNANHQAFLDAAESYSFNAIGVASSDSAIVKLYDAYGKRLRDEMGIKFQVVGYNNAADFEGFVNVKNKVTDDGWDASSLVYWVTGVVAGTAVNRSATNKIYDGEFTVDTGYTQSQLEAAIDAGEFTLHRVGSDMRVLVDINSLVTTSDTKGDVFKDNQTIRVIDQIANDIATLFNTKYLGVVPNDESGRISLWVDIVKHHTDLQTIRAIENFSDSDVTVEQGDSKRAVVVSDVITVVNAMNQLYMTCVVQ